jgi:hypothetical protein
VVGRVDGYGNPHNLLASVSQAATILYHRRGDGPCAKLEPHLVTDAVSMPTRTRHLVRILPTHVGAGYGMDVVERSTVKAHR